MKIKFNDKINSKNLILVVFEENLADKDYSAKNFTAYQQQFSKMLDCSKFDAKFASSVISFNLTGEIDRLVIVGGGKFSEVNEFKLARIGGAILKICKEQKLDDVGVILPHEMSEKMIAHLAYGLSLRNYSFNKYKSEAKILDAFIPGSICFIHKNSTKAEQQFLRLENVAKGVKFARDLVSEPANILYPESMSEQCMKLADLGVKVEVLDVEQMQKLGMNALLGVGQGSSKASRLVVMSYDGGKKGDAPLAFVGKGVTFDTGGISLKPSGGMEDMKYDMAGSAAVVGVMMALAGRAAKVNVVGVVGLVENMPDGNAQRPSDVVRSMSGQTIEILNTDAEGRLVLADALWYTQHRFKPKIMVNLATLTGAITIALGSTYAGLFSNNDILADNLYKAGLEVEEKLWRLPLHNDYDKDIDSDIADVRNTQRTERSAGSITAAQFLQRFVNNVPWAHLDIAGVAWDRKGSDVCPKGATAFGVRLLNKLVELSYED